MALFSFTVICIVFGIIVCNPNPNDSFILAGYKLYVYSMEKKCKSFKILMYWNISLQAITIGILLIYILESV